MCRQVRIVYLSITFATDIVGHRAQSCAALYYVLWKEIYPIRWPFLMHLLCMPEECSNYLNNPISYRQIITIVLHRWYNDPIPALWNYLCTCKYYLLYGTLKIIMFIPFSFFQSAMVFRVLLVSCIWQHWLMFLHQFFQFLSIRMVLINCYWVHLAHLWRTEKLIHQTK